jgi:hypothetical protein
MSSSFRVHHQRSRTKRQWQAIQFREKRAITASEHERIIATEHNSERRAFYELCWHLGGVQTDIANLCAEDVDWEVRTVGFFRKKPKAFRSFTSTASWRKFCVRYRKRVRSFRNSKS